MSRGADGPATAVPAIQVLPPEAAPGGAAPIVIIDLCASDDDQDEAMDPPFAAPTAAVACPTPSHARRQKVL